MNSALLPTLSFLIVMSAPCYVQKYFSSLDYNPTSISILVINSYYLNRKLTLGRGSYFACSKPPIPLVPRFLRIVVIASHHCMLHLSVGVNTSIMVYVGKLLLKVTLIWALWSILSHAFIYNLPMYMKKSIWAPIRVFPLLWATPPLPASTRV